jgi:hypothetical protein
MRNSDGKLAGWDLPHDHFVIEEIPEVKYPQYYQATFGGTPGTAHMTGEEVVFVYFNHGSKTFERFKISTAHAHMVIPTEKTSCSTSRARSYSTSEIGSAADTRDAYANCSATATNAWDAHADSPASTVNNNAGYHNPSKYGVSNEQQGSRCFHK